MENIFYSWGIIYLAYKISILLYKPDSQNKTIDKNDPHSVLEWAKSNPRIIIPTLTWIWFVVGLFTHLWWLFLILILLEITYHKVYEISKLNSWHKLFWHIHHLTEMLVVVSILIFHFFITY